MSILTYEDGSVDGCEIGWMDGWSLGRPLGRLVGWSVGTEDGCFDGCKLGSLIYGASSHNIVWNQYTYVYVLYDTLYIIQLTMTVSWMAERSDYSRVEYLAEN